MQDKDLNESININNLPIDFIFPFESLRYFLLRCYFEYFQERECLSKIPNLHGQKAFPT